MALQKDYKSFHLDLTGRLIKSLDKSKLIFVQEDKAKIDNFSSLKNIKYTDNGIIGITGGMTKINSSALSHPKIRNMFHFNKSFNKESHVMVQAFNSAQTESKVFRNDTTIPNTGNFNATALHTDTVATGTITAFAQNGLSVTVTSANHGLYAGDELIITGTTSYNGVFKIDNVTLNTFDIVDTWVADDATGTWTSVLQGRFSASPDEHAVYCNGRETMVYGGDKTQISRFEVIKIDESELYDYSDKVRNTLTDSDNLAKLVQTPAANATLAKLLMHLDNNLTDSIGTHTPTGASITYDASNKVFGTHAGVFSGSAGVFISVPSHADFNISDGTLTFNARIRPTSLAANRGIFSHGLNGATTDYLQLYVDTAGNLKLDVVTAATGTLNLATTDTPIAINTFYDIKLCGTPNGAGAYNYYLFIDGALKVSSLGSAVVMIDLSSSTHPVLIGGLTDGTTDSLPFLGQIDEVFFTNYYCLHTATFTIPTSAYGTDTAVFMRLSNTMPIDAINYAIQVANATAGTAMVFYWNGNGWTTSGTITDGTAASGKSLAQTGSMSFNSTATTAKQKMVDGIMGFYYLVRVANADAATRISNITVRVPFQKLQDFWDGELVPVASVQMLDAGVFIDWTTNVLKDEFTYDNSTGFDESTYARLSVSAVNNISTDEYLAIGLLKRFMAVSVKIIPRKANTTVATLIVERWNGSAWVKVKNLVDGTRDGSKSMASSGIVSWSSDENDLEFKTKIGSRSEALYYIKFRWSAYLGDVNLFVYYIGGVPVQGPIVNYKFPLFAQNRLWLFDKTEAIASNYNTLNVFNGKDSGDPFRFGNSSETVAAVELFTRTTTTSESVILVLKQSAIHLINGSNPEDWKVVDLSNVGCNAPLTVATSLIGFEFSALNRRQIAIWQSSGGLYMFDNNAIFPISGDISNYFDQTKSEAINLKFADKSYSFMETENGEHFYHWCFASGSSATSINTELVFDVNRQKWFEVARGTGKALQGGSSVVDPIGNIYTYGFEDNGYLQRLNAGTAYDGNSIVYEFEFGDILLTNDINMNTIIELLRLITVSKETTTANITVTHYGDTNDTGTDYTFEPARVGYRLAMPASRIYTKKHILHRFKFTITTNNENGTGFEPLYVGGLYRLPEFAEDNLTD